MDDDACRRKMAEYAGVIEEKADHVFEVMAPRCTPGEMAKLHEAFQLAYEAHSHQFRRSGEPYILHPIAVATIAAEELWLDAAPVIAAFLHDVVEDTDYTNDDIRERFGDDVAFLVRVVTKSKRSGMGRNPNRWPTIGRCSTPCNMTFGHFLSNSPTASTTCGPYRRCAPISK